MSVSGSNTKFPLKRFLKWLALIGAALLLLGVGAWFAWLFQAQANLDAAMAEFKAAGGVLDKEKLIPAPVPDEENAAIPLREAGFFEDDPEWEDRVDEVAGWYREASNYGDEIVWDKVRKELASPEFELPMAAFSEAAGRPAYNPQLDYDLGFALLLPHVGKFRNVATLKTMQARVLFMDGDRDKAMTLLSEVLKMAAFLREEKAIISLLTGTAMETQVLDALEALPLSDYQSEPMATIVEGLLIGDVRLDLLHAYNLEYVFMGIHGFDEFIKNPQETRKYLDMIAPIGMGADRRQRRYPVTRASILNDKAAFTRCMAVGMEELQLPYYEAHGMRMEYFQKHIEGNTDYPISNLLLISIEVASERVLKTQTRSRISALALLLNRYHAEQGSYPDTLDALVPDYLDSLPEDDFSPDGFRYEVRDDGFLLYSIGPNLIDDGGQSSAEEEYLDETGDIVWQGAGASDAP